MDAPKEGTVNQLDDLPISVNSVSERRGKGPAISAGFEGLETEILTFVDSTGATPAESFRVILEPVQKGTADIAVGSRRHPKSEIFTQQTRLRKLLGDGYAWLARQLIEPRLYDYQCGAKVITAEQWDLSKKHVNEPGFAWDIMLLSVAAEQNATVHEVPIHWKDQPESTVNPIKDTLSMFSGLFKVYFKTHIAVPFDE